jgi:hypothetical protein
MEGTSTRDFTKGFPVDDLQNGGMIQGKVTDEDVILARHADEFFCRRSRLYALPWSPLGRVDRRR